MSRLVKIPEILFVLAIPLFILSASVAWAVNDEGLYQQGFDNYNISGRTGISQVDLRMVGAEFRRYFKSPEEPFSVRAKVYGGEHIGYGELPVFSSDVRVEGDLNQQVTQLFRQRARVAPVDGFQHLVTLLQQITLERIVSLLPVPGTTAGCPKPLDNANQSGKISQFAFRNLFFQHGRIIEGRTVAQQARAVLT